MKKKMTTKRTFIVEIEVDNINVIKKYPNYRFNYNKPLELIKGIANNIKWQGETDMSKNGMKEWGYSIKIKQTKNK